jgi:hypothetical protein
MVAMGDITYPKVNQIAATKLTIDSEIKHCQISYAFANLQVNSDGPDIFQLERWLLTDQLAFVPRLVGMNVFHDRLLIWLEGTYMTKNQVGHAHAGAKLDRKHAFKIIESGHSNRSCQLPIQKLATVCLGRNAATLDSQPTP